MHLTSLCSGQILENKLGLPSNVDRTQSVEKSKRSDGCKDAKHMAAPTDTATWIILEPGIQRAA